jgi:hypothetical protein
MQVDRVIKDRLDSFTFERETEYRHPPLYSLEDRTYSSSISLEKKRAEQRARVEPPCTDIELIGKTLIQFDGCV